MSLSRLRRPIRPPNSYFSPSKPRLFTQNSQLLLVTSSHNVPRPQLPFLHGSIRRIPQQPGGQWQLTRFLTTEQKRHFKYQFKLFAKTVIFGSAILFCWSIIKIGLHHEILERTFPSPHCWGFRARWMYRNACASERPDLNGTGKVTWWKVAEAYAFALTYVEYPGGEGKGLKEQEQAKSDVRVPGLGELMPEGHELPVGYDLTEKDEPWRRGYFELLMGTARVAEHMDMYVIDASRQIPFHRDFVIGPSNPNPDPVPPGGPAAPLEENCKPSFPPPVQFYNKVITAKGFTTRQRVQAALACADFLESKDYLDTAEAMYRWALDIASSALSGRESILDTKTGVIHESGSRLASSNLLLATTSLATHLAKRGDVSAALPIFLSVLRARRSAEEPAPGATSEPAEEDTMLLKFLKAVRPVEYPPPPPCGDNPIVRHPNTRCEEAALMTHMGEILFATSPSQHSKGLGWTQEAVDVAEAGISDRRLNDEEREKCSECLEVGLENMLKMFDILAEEAKNAKAKGSRKGWLRWWASDDGAEAVPEGQWEQEAQMVQSRLEKARSDHMQRRLMAEGAKRGLTWMF